MEESRERENEADARGPDGKDEKTLDEAVAARLEEDEMPAEISHTCPVATLARTVCDSFDARVTRRAPLICFHPRWSTLKMHFRAC